MKEQTLVKIAAGTMIIGFLLLLLLASDQAPPSPASWDQASLEQPIIIQGIVSRATPHDKVFFLRIGGQRYEEMDVVFFPKEDIFIQEGDMIQVSGTMTEYQGKKEIVAQEVILLGSRSAAPSDLSTYALPAATTIPSDTDNRTTGQSPGAEQ